VACRSVGLSVTLVSTAKTAEPIGMPFWVEDWGWPRNHVLDGGPDPPMERGNFEGKGRSIVKYRDTMRSSVQKWLNRSRCPRNRVLDRSPEMLKDDAMASNFGTQFAITAFM